MDDFYESTDTRHRHRHRIPGGMSTSVVRIQGSSSRHACRSDPGHTISGRYLSKIYSYRHSPKSRLTRHADNQVI